MDRAGRTLRRPAWNGGARWARHLRAYSAWACRRLRENCTNDRPGRGRSARGCATAGTAAVHAQQASIAPAKIRGSLASCHSSRSPGTAIVVFAAGVYRRGPEGRRNEKTATRAVFRVESGDEPDPGTGHNS